MTIFTADEIPDELIMKVPPGQEVRCPRWVDLSHKLPENGFLRNYLFRLDHLVNASLVKGCIDWNEIKKKFEEQKIIKRSDIIEYLAANGVWLGKICNKKFFDGEASIKPQRFKCPSCRGFTTFIMVVN